MNIYALVNKNHIPDVTKKECKQNPANVNSKKQTKPDMNCTNCGKEIKGVALAMTTSDPKRRNQCMECADVFEERGKWKKIGRAINRIKHRKQEIKWKLSKLGANEEIISAVINMFINSNQDTVRIAFLKREIKEALLVKRESEKTRPTGAVEEIETTAINDLEKSSFQDVDSNLGSQCVTLLVAQSAVSQALKQQRQDLMEKVEKMRREDAQIQFNRWQADPNGKDDKLEPMAEDRGYNFAINDIINLLSPGE